MCLVAIETKDYTTDIDCIIAHLFDAYIGKLFKFPTKYAHSAQRFHCMLVDRAKKA